LRERSSLRDEIEEDDDSEHESGAFSFASVVQAENVKPYVRDVHTYK